MWCNFCHRDYWYSSPTYASGFAVNHIVNSAILFSGLSEMQFIRFCKFIHMSHQSATTFFRHQRLYAAPTVNQEYGSMQSCVIEQLKSSSAVILSGDCRMDSPGFFATKGTYSFMDYESNMIIAMAHGDKRQVRKYTYCECMYISYINTADT